MKAGATSTIRTNTKMKRTSMSIFLPTMAVVMAVLLGCSAAQTTHNVGGSLGWGLVPGGQSAYTSWARNQSFTLGDTLAFTFADGQHDVTEVSRGDFDACNTNNPIFTITNSPARVALNSTGSHYYICTFSGHCTAGQKLQVNVTAAASSSPAPQPAAPVPRASTPAPTASSPAPEASSPSTPPAATPSSSPSPSTVTNSAPAPGPTSRGATTYTVGDNIGNWTIPNGGAAAYQRWASDKTFMVGDVLVFNYPSGQHDVTEVTRQSYQSCSGSNPITRETNPPTRITLTTAGEHYFICTVNGHCSAGQQLAINVTGGSSNATPPPSPSTTSVPSAPSPADSSATSLGFAAATLFSLVVALFFVF